MYVYGRLTTVSSNNNVIVNETQEGFALQVKCNN